MFTVPSLSHLTSCTPTKSNLYLANSLAAAISEPALYRLLTFQVPYFMSLFCFLGHTKVSVYVRGFVCEYFVTTIRFYSEELLVPRPTPKLEDQSLSAVRGCLLNIFAANLRIGGSSSIRNLRTRHAVVTGTHYHMDKQLVYDTKYIAH
jgi:hypothetical protein